MKCTAITLMENIGDDLSILSVDIDGNNVGLMLLNYNDALEFVDQEVVYSLRTDIFKGEKRQFINTLTRVVTISTVSRGDEKAIRLFPTSSTLAGANVSFDDMQTGDAPRYVTVYCAKAEYKSSSKATWAEFTVLDRNRHAEKARLFSPIGDPSLFVGSFVTLKAVRNKYGVNAESIEKVDGNYAEDPNMTVCETYIQELLSTNSLAQRMLADLNMFPHMRKNTDISPGLPLISLAIELSLLEDMANYLPKFNKQMVQQALVAGKSYTTREKYPFGEDAKNVMLVCQSSYLPIAEILVILDKDCINNPIEKEIYNSVRESAKSVLRVRKDLPE